MMFLYLSFAAPALADSVVTVICHPGSGAALAGLCGIAMAACLALLLAGLTRVLERLL